MRYIKVSETHWSRHLCALMHTNTFNDQGSRFCLILYSVKGATSRQSQTEWLKIDERHRCESCHHRDRGNRLSGKHSVSKNRQGTNTMIQTAHTSEGGSCTHLSLLSCRHNSHDVCDEVMCPSVFVIVSLCRHDSHCVCVDASAQT